MSKWQLIETAPKIPGKDILVYRPSGDINGYIPQVGVDYWSEKLGWAKSNPYKKPTHWRPLPEPPK